MPFVLGIDTGGTYTDAVILDPNNKEILCKAKAFTTNRNLMDGICNCINQFKHKNLEKVKMVCLSTTLATNAVVEGRGGSVGLLTIGRTPKIDPPVVFQKQLYGKLDIKGNEILAIDERQAKQTIQSLAKFQVDAVAISGYASVRNPIHELQVKKMILAYIKGVPIVCAHELTATLGFDNRTITTVLNARLIPIVSDLMKATESVLKEKNIDAKVMVVKGDGSLVKASVALDKPIETILSGPAASITGGMFLTGENDALIVDIGGTTTDIARVKDGAVKIKDEGAYVGGWFTRIRAAEICTYGVGGDSYIRVDSNGKIQIGPKKVMPLCVAGEKYPHLCLELKELGQIERYELFSEQETDCFLLNKRLQKNVCEQDEAIINMLKDGPHSTFYLASKLDKAVKSLSLTRLVDLDILKRISVTPTDVLHVLGKYNRWDDEAAFIGVEMLARKINQSTVKFAEDAFKQVVGRLTFSCLQSAAEFSGHDMQLESSKEAMYFIGCADTKDNLLQTRFCINRPIVAIGAPVRAWMPAVCDKLHTSVIIPEHAEVANAVGAAVGQVIEAAEVLIRPGRKHKNYIVHAPWAREVFDTREEAMEYVIPAALAYVEKKIQRSGSDDYQITKACEDRYVDSQKKEYIETRVKATACGSPRI